MAFGVALLAVKGGAMAIGFTDTKSEAYQWGYEQATERGGLTEATCPFAAAGAAAAATTHMPPEEAETWAADFTEGCIDAVDDGATGASGTSSGLEDTDNETDTPAPVESEAAAATPARSGKASLLARARGCTELPNPPGWDVAPGYEKWKCVYDVTITNGSGANIDVAQGRWRLVAHSGMFEDDEAGPCVAAPGTECSTRVSFVVDGMNKGKARILRVGERDDLAHWFKNY